MERDDRTGRSHKTFSNAGRQVLEGSSSNMMMNMMMVSMMKKDDNERYKKKEVITQALEVQGILR